MKYLIIGGVAGGATTAARLRRVDENSEIIMLEKGPYISYANCGLPYYIGGIIKDRSKLLVQTPEGFGKRFNIDVRTLSEAIEIDSEKKEVSVLNHQTKETYKLSYDKLVLSPGAKPVIPPIPGINSPKILTLRNVEDTDRIKEFVDKVAPKKAVVIGAGFIGLEMAENLHHRNIQVSVVEAAPQVMNMIDPEMASIIHQHFKEQEVGLILDDAVASFEEINNQVHITLNSGRVLVADIAILSIGVKPDTTLAQKAGIELGVTGGVKVDPYLQTSKEDIYSLGDSMEFPHPITNKPTIAYLAGPANKQGRLLADNMTFGHKRAYKGAIGTAIAKVFDLTVATTGLSEKQLIKEGIPYKVSITINGSHAGYYPGATQMTSKILFSSDDGRVLGAQIVGEKGVDKRIDMLATIIGVNGDIYDLQDVEHAYAPPFSSAKDPVNQVAFNAENILKGLSNHLSPYEMKNRGEDIFLLDVRTPMEYDLGHIDGAIQIEVDELRQNLNRIPKEKTIYLYCGIGLRGYVATRILLQNGYEHVYNLSGGYKLYTSATDIQENPILIEKKQSNNESTHTESKTNNMHKVDATGLQCPGPISLLKEEVDKIQLNETLEITASDMGFYRDVESWCNVTGNTLISKSKKDGMITAQIQKTENNDGFSITSKGDDKTIVVFSDDLDKALASFVIANGAAAMGKNVTMFFTFWGLNILKDPKAPKAPKDMMGKMFGWMMPSSSKALTLSKMNMMGMGSKMMRYRMLSKKVDALETMIGKAKLSGIELIGCQMSMDVMGVDSQEFISGVKVGGVANYLEAAEKSNVNLFI
ncbi:FAD-dependent oxidoreductase [Halosquirtibacter xylanolyticus]|uniref:FAD-dependent oxidoreductase n=1 Tax=Halosquirtibacter xylanolyticus TaxID=3374599 RepID=UPI003748D5FE|nr:FAD-dependent oxidoreductase [Prolixibacteraceae bacterium]